jgi:hypothetical protein
MFVPRRISPIRLARASRSRNFFTYNKHTEVIFETDYHTEVGRQLAGSLCSAFLVVQESHRCFSVYFLAYRYDL